MQRLYTRSTQIITVLLVLIIALALLGTWGFYKNHTLSNQVANLQKSLMKVETEVASTTKTIPPQELANRQTVVQKSQDQLLTSAVAKTAPAVVSIVISQYAPQCQITYENPFGDDPLFKDFGFRIPVCKQTGTTLKKVGAGTGILFTADGYIVTNRHVIFDPNAQYTVLLANGNQKPATVIYRDPNTDIAIVKISGTSPAVASLGNSDTLKLGQTVAAIGNALGEYNNSVSVGIISGLNRQINAEDEQGNTETLSHVIQTDAAINPGNSGGPLIDLNGNVIGINVATVVGSNSIGFAIPINAVKPILNRYK